MSKRPELIVTSGGFDGRRFAVPAGGLRVGRSSANDLHLPDEELSRNHCLFEHEGEADIRVLDLASANGTFVNGEQLGFEARVLKVGDVIVIGSSELRVVGESDSAAPAAPAAAPAKPAAPAPAASAAAPVGAEVDLGLGPAATEAETAEAKEDPASPEAKRRKIINLICASVATALVLAICAIMGWLPFFDNGPSGGAKKARRTAEAGERTGDAAGSGGRFAGDALSMPARLVYERVEGSPEKIVRYAAEIVGTEVTLSYDVQSPDATKCQKLPTEHGRLSAYSQDQLKGLFDADEWYELGSTRGESVQASNLLKSWRLKLVRGGQVKEVVVENTAPNDYFARLCRMLETLVNKDLDIELTLRQPEECLAASRKQEEVGDRLIKQADIKPDNLWEGIRNLKLALNELKGLSRYYEDQQRLKDKIAEAEKTLEARYESYHSAGSHAHQTGAWLEAQTAFRAIRDMIPDEADPRCAEADTKLRDIAGRLEEARRRSRK